MSEIPDGFLARWSRRKAQARRGIGEAEPPVTEGARPQAVPATPATPQAAPAAAGSTPVAPLDAAGAHEPPPTMADVALLTPESDFKRFVASGVPTDVRNAALRKLFADPRFNVMDGLDVYIDDYNVPDPLPAGMLQRMVQARCLGLVTGATEPEGAPLAGPSSQDAGDVAVARAADAPPADGVAAHEDADLQLQPHDDAGRARAAPGAVHDAGRER